jgi:hypothetical protein
MPRLEHIRFDPLFYDALSGEFKPSQDPEGRSHTLDLHVTDIRLIDDKDDENFLFVSRTMSVEEQWIAKLSAAEVESTFGLELSADMDQTQKAVAEAAQNFFDRAA